MVETPKNDIENVNNVLDVLQKGITNMNINKLEKTIVAKEKMEKTAKESMTKIGEIFKIKIPFLGEIGNLFGTKRPIDLLGTKEERKKNKVLNGILKSFGFKNGMEEIHKLYIENELKGIDKNFADDTFKEYKNTEKTEITDSQKTRNICELNKIFGTVNEEEKTALQDKIPQDFEGLKNSLIKMLPNYITKLNINTVNMVGEPFIGTDENNHTTIKHEEIQKNIPGFIDKYLKLTIPELAKHENNFIDGDNTNTDVFAYVLFGNLTGEKFFIEGVSLGLLNAPVINREIHENKTNTNNENIKEDVDQIQKIESELKSVKNCPLTAEMIINASKQNNVPTAYLMAIMKNDSSYGTAGKGAKTHNPGNVGNTDDGSTKDRGTREAGVNAVAENLARRIDEYQKIYGKDKMPSIKELAQNKGPDGKGFLSNQGNYKKDNQKRLGAYMTSEKGQEKVKDIAENLIQDGITNNITLT